MQASAGKSLIAFFISDDLWSFQIYHSLTKWKVMWTRGSIMLPCFRYWFAKGQWQLITIKVEILYLWHSRIDAIPLHFELD